MNCLCSLNENLSKIAKLLYEKSTNIGTNTSQEVLIGSEKKYKDFSDYTFLVVTINLNNNVGFFTELLFNSGSNFQKYMFTTGGNPNYYWAVYFAIRSDGIYINPNSYYEAHYIKGVKIYGIK